MSLAILNNLDAIATFAAGCFVGTALYITTGEVPAMRKLGLDEHWRFFPYMYERAVISQGFLASTTGIAAIVHGTRIIGSTNHRNLWIVSGSVFLGIIAYTFIFVAPTNQRIIGDNKRMAAGNESQVDAITRKKLLDKWALLHLVRTVSSVVSFGAMVYGLGRHLHQ